LTYFSGLPPRPNRQSFTLVRVIQRTDGLTAAR
jgi:hypothetical protein